MKICPRCADFFGDESAFCPHDGASLEKSNDRFLGRTIASRYRLIRRLGSGGMSVVYLARHELIARLSAIKILRPELSLVTEHRERFLREARAVNRINHENIAEITDVGESDGLAYLVMEFVEGESMLTNLQRGRLPWPRAARIGMQVASALARAHQMGVIHRDLKPDNILLVKRDAADVESEHVKLTDFGIAKLTSEPSLTVNEELFGTPGYIAPEYVGGIGIDGRSDIYSLAVVLYEMITGVLPFDAKGQSELLLMPLTCLPIPPSQRMHGLPPELESFLMRCLARDPAERPHDAFAMHDALADLVHRFAPRRDSARSPRHEPPASSAHEPTETVLDMHVASARGDADPSLARTEAHDRTRWISALGDLEARVAKAQAIGGARARAAAQAAELAIVAGEMIPRLERASTWVGELQARVDALEATGREFRASLGHAIDVLVHDRSRERAHLDALRARRRTLEHVITADAIARDAIARDAVARDAIALDASARLRSSTPTSDDLPVLGPPASDDPPVLDLPPGAPEDAETWEIEALAAEEARAATVDDDLAFQIAALQEQLDAKNEAFERELIQGTGQLEGALSALRRLTSEVARTIDDGIDVLKRSA